MVEGAQKHRRGKENLRERALRERRKFLKKAGKAAATAPAVALLLSVSGPSAEADIQQPLPSGQTDFVVGR